MNQEQNTPKTGENTVAAKKIIFSGIQPTGGFTLGNYLGSVRNWSALQDDYDCIYSIADLHAITVRQDPAKLRAQSLASYALLLACGVDPNRSTVFIQSQVPAHTQLTWILSCSTAFGELTRMTQFKDKAKSHPDDVNDGLFQYPVLMAADILLYQTDLVPVGEDQRQHLELARNIAIRFNGRYGDLFTVPEGYMPPVGAKIRSLQEPEKKMSKSDENQNAVVGILDDRDTIIRKFKRAVTDSESEICCKEGKDGINNLMTILSCATGDSFDKIQADFANKGYGDFKLAVGETIADMLRPIQEEYNRLLGDKTYLKECYTAGREIAMARSRKILAKASKKVGFADV